MAEAAVSFAVETISNLLIEEAKFLDGVSDQVEQLQLTLKRMQSFLKDADEMQHEGTEMLKEWISQARDLAYEADDLIESYAFKVASRRRMKGIRGILKRCACILDGCYARHTIGAVIRTLKTKISDLTRSFQDSGIRAVVERQQDEASSLNQQLRRTYSHVVEDDFVGLEDDVEMLVKHLSRGSDHDHEIDQHYRVVSICGMGGLGKTTLARKIYNHPKVRRCFDGLAWVCVSQKWQKEDILQRMLLSLIPQKRKEILEWRDEELVRQLFQILQNRKCLVVLDDIWSTEPWECIKQAFPITKKKGYRILVTTRNKDVALHIDPNGFHHQPRLLSDSESWELLQRKALWHQFDGEHEYLKKLENLGKEMVKACRGLPLAVIVLGGTLATKKNLNEWAIVTRNIKAYLGRGNNLIKEEGNLHKILALSYNDLPYKLKPCFLYLSRYEEDSDIDTEALYQLWIAEGIISTKDQIGGESMMDVAERYLGELVTRCMVQGKAPDDDDVMLSSIGRSFASCRLHDLMRDLSLLKAKEENFLLSTSCYHDGILDQQGNNDCSQVYRLAIRFSGDARKYVPPAEKRNTRHLRSLAFLASGDEGYEGRVPKKMKSEFTRFKMLRVLAIEGLSPADLKDPILKSVFLMLGDHLRLPKAVGKLIHLRYLSLRSSLFLCLPSSLGNLQNLQTLDLRAAVHRIPNVLWKMRQLRYLYLPDSYSDRMVGKIKLDLCCKKLRLKGLDKLEILENFCPPICSSQDISTLKSLRVLSAEMLMMNFDDEHFPTEIHRLMSNSGHVHCTSLYIACNTAKIPIADLTRKKFSDAVGQCFSSRNLQVLQVKGPLTNFPKYEAQYMYSSLLKLKLTLIEVEEDFIETLERLPNLRSLHLEKVYIFEGKIRCRAIGFGQLRFLRFECLRDLNKWNVEEGAMPNLSVLTIVYCPKLEMIPNGLIFVKSLKELNIVSMPKEFTDRIQAANGEDQGQDFDKVSHIPPLVSVIFYLSINIHQIPLSCQQFQFFLEFYSNL